MYSKLPLPGGTELVLGNSVPCFYLPVSRTHLWNSIFSHSIILNFSVFLYDVGLSMCGHIGFLNLCISLFCVLVLISLWLLIEDLLAMGVCCHTASDLQVWAHSIVEGALDWKSEDLVLAVLWRVKTLSTSTWSLTRQFGRAVRPQLSQSSLALVLYLENQGGWNKSVFFQNILPGALIWWTS